jgi:uncharacterized protein (UPF0332 family)
VPLLNHNHLLDQAEKLAAAPAAGQPRQANIRRAVSSAYYGVFHFVVASVTDQFVGKTKRTTSEYGRVYRSIDHRAIRELCDDLKKPNLPTKYKPYEPAGGFGDNISEFAAAFVDLLEERHSADYDPMISVTLSEAQSAIKTARAAIKSFEKASRSRQRTFLSLLLFAPRR